MRNLPVLFKKYQFKLSLPSMMWLIFFFIFPTFAIFLISFHASDSSGEISKEWTLQTWRLVFTSNYLPIVARTLVLSILTTLGCITLAIPTAYTITKSQPRLRRLLLLLVIVPFWINFLIRIFAWKVLLHPEGYLKQGLVLLGIIDNDAILLYGSGAVLLVMIYSYLPFAILPIYAAAEKFDYALMEAAADLGASPLKAFWRVFLPGIKRGILSAMMMVFIPALGAYVIPDMVGGSQSEMISTKIAQKAFVDRNLPQASALSALLTSAVLMPYAVSYLYQSIRRREKT
jgi:spermidine/putrescine transport system permease protein